MKSHWIDSYLAKIEKPARAQLAFANDLNDMARALARPEPPAQVVTIADKRRAFGAMLGQVEEYLLALGVLLAEMIDEDPTTPEKLLKEYPHLSAGWLSALERVGRRRLDYRVLLMGGTVGSRLMSLPYHAQQAVLDNPIPVVNPQTYRIEHKPLKDLTVAEIDRAIGRDGIIHVDDQRASIELEKKEQERKDRGEGRYFFNGLSVFFNVRGPYRSSDLEEIAATLKTKEIANLQTNMKKAQIPA